LETTWVKLFQSKERGPEQTTRTLVKLIPKLVDEQVVDIDGVERTVTVII